MLFRSGESGAKYSAECNLYVRGAGTSSPMAMTGALQKLGSHGVEVAAAAAGSRASRTREVMCALMGTAVLPSYATLGVRHKATEAQLKSVGLEVDRWTLLPLDVEGVYMGYDGRRVVIGSAADWARCFRRYVTGEHDVQPCISLSIVHVNIGDAHPEPRAEG